MIHPVLSTVVDPAAHLMFPSMDPSHQLLIHLAIDQSEGLVPHSLKPNFERASLIGRALPHKEISVLYRRPPRMDEAGLKLSSGSNEQANLVPMIHPVLSTSCGSEASPPH
ncbi:hypothetical protein FCV25MIE_19454, partial [Fagus crenata]